MAISDPAGHDPRTGRPTDEGLRTLTALLTLSLKDVVVEGPDGFFRRRIAL